MILNIRSTLTTIVTIILTVALLLIVVAGNVQSAEYNPLDPACTGSAASSPACAGRNRSGNPLVGPNGIITKITRFVAVIVGVASIIMIMLGGYTYITSNGDPQKTNAAKDTILYAVIGLVIAAAAGLIIGFVLSKF